MKKPYKIIPKSIVNICFLYQYLKIILVSMVLTLCMLSTACSLQKNRTLSSGIGINTEDINQRLKEINKEIEIIKKQGKLVAQAYDSADKLYIKMIVLQKKLEELGKQLNLANSIRTVNQKFKIILEEEKILLQSLKEDLNLL